MPSKQAVEGVRAHLQAAVAFARAMNWVTPEQALEEWHMLAQASDDALARLAGQVAVAEADLAREMERAEAGEPVRQDPKRSGIAPDVRRKP